MLACNSCRSTPLNVAANPMFPTVLVTVRCRLPSDMLAEVSDRVALSVVLREKRMMQTGALFPWNVSLMAPLSGLSAHLQASGIGCGVLVTMLMLALATLLSPLVTVLMPLSAVSTSRNRALGSASSGIRYV